MAQKADVDYLSDVISADAILQHIIEFGFGAFLLESDDHSQHGTVDLQVWSFHTLCVCVVPCTMCGLYILHMSSLAKVSIFLGKCCLLTTDSSIDNRFLVPRSWTVAVVVRSIAYPAH